MMAVGNEVDTSAGHIDGGQDMSALARLKPRTAPGRLIGAITVVALATTGILFVLARQGHARPTATAAASAPCAVPGPHQSAGPPVLAVVGASFSAGVGAGTPSQAWPAELGRILRWPVHVSADPGAGYTRPGAGHRGPFNALTARLDLAALRPAVILVQGGHNDIGQPLPRISRAVRALLDQIRCETPATRIGIVTVFATGNRPATETFRTDQAIVTAARQADPKVMVFDPLAEHWQFPRTGDQLHPTSNGHQWIADRVAAGLRGHGVPGTAPAASHA
jgi:lysophospholipase L1-like esterase